MKKDSTKPSFKIPDEITNVTKTLKNVGFEAFLVGGCVRDLILNRKPKDWDVTTNATPEKIISLFNKTYYENNFGTVGVSNENTEDETLKIVEVTPYRTESEYSDFRRPDSVVFSNKLEDDLQRRDFTMNAIAYDINTKNIIDPYKGQNDIKNKIIRTVGDPEKRFGEDGLRIIRAIRFHAELGFTINTETQKAIENKAILLEKIARERIRDEFSKIIMSDNPMDSMVFCHKIGILKYVCPELEKSIGVHQGHSHIYDVWTHSLKALQHSADKKCPLYIRLAVLFHDIGKPKSKRGIQSPTFYGHEVVGEKIVRKILENLKYSKEIIDNVSKLVRWHMFFSDTEQITLSAVRRLIVNVGKENVWDLMKVRECDRIGMGRPKEDPYRLRKYKSMIEEAMTDPISVGMLKINGNDVINTIGVKPGPKIGHILHALFEEVLDDPRLNTKEYLEKRSIELSKLNEKELKAIGEKGKETKTKEEEKQKKEIRKKYFVR